MPAVRNYIVTQEREIKIMATSPSEAIAFAKDMFRINEDNHEPREIRVEAREEF